MLFLRVGEVSRSSQLRRLTATVLSGLVVLGVCSLCVSGSSASAKPRHKTHSAKVRAAHVRVDTAVLRSGPNRKTHATALLDAGRKARILEHREGWVKLRLASGTEGWVRSDLLAISKKRVDVSEVEGDGSSSRRRRKHGKSSASSTKTIIARKASKPSSRRVALHTAPKLSPSPARPAKTVLSNRVLAEARKPFSRQALIRGAERKVDTLRVRESFPQDKESSEKETSDPALTVVSLPKEVTVDSDIPPEVLQPAPMPSDTDTVEVDPEPMPDESPAPVLPEEKPAISEHDLNIVRSALSYRGTPYRLGATGRGAFDCSGFTRFILNRNGASLPRTAAEQYHHGTPISRNELKPGDLVFFKNTYKRGISHVGIYIGEDRFVHAATYRTGVTVSSLSASYYARHYAGARRVH